MITFIPIIINTINKAKNIIIGIITISINKPNIAPIIKDKEIINLVMNNVINVLMMKLPSTALKKQVGKYFLQYYFISLPEKCAKINVKLLRCATI